MKRYLAVLLIVTNIMLHISANGVSAEEISGPGLTTTTYILMEAKSGQVICSSNADKQVHPASITKIMTLLLAFEALERGQIKLTDQVSVSEHAASMGGSQVFLEPSEVQSVDTLIKCISMASANDASVALAEHICGSEEQFVARMNEKAKELNMTNTHFVNTCGLDDENHKMSARDIAIMSRELINKYPQIHSYSTIWMDTITHKTRRGESEFGLTNTNKLIKQYQYATGLKTGSTSKAGCCLSATAKKDGVELIAVIMAAPNSKARFSDATTLLNYGFGACKMYTDTLTQKQARIKVNGGDKSHIQGKYKEDFNHMFLGEFNKDAIRYKNEYRKNIKAPIRKGECIGQRVYYYEDEVIGSVDIVSSHNVKRAAIGDGFKKILDKFF